MQEFTLPCLTMTSLALGMLSREKKSLGKNGLFYPDLTLYNNPYKLRICLIEDNKYISS